jgi:hypothetical protein
MQNGLPEQQGIEHFGTPRIRVQTGTRGKMLIVGVSTGRWKYNAIYEIREGGMWELCSHQKGEVRA